MSITPRRNPGCGWPLRLFFCSLLFLRVSIGFAEDPEPLRLSFRECLTRAEGHPVLSSALREAEAALARLDWGRSLGRPALTVISLGGLVPDASGDALQTTTPTPDRSGQFSHLGEYIRFEILLEQPLFTFGKLDAGIRALDERAAAAQSEEAWVRRRFHEVIRQLYDGRLYVDELRRLLSELDGLLKEAGERLEQALAEESGAVTAVDRMKFQVVEAGLRQQALEVERKARDLNNGMCRVLALPEGTDWAPKETRLRAEPVPTDLLDRLRRADLAAHPQLTAARHAVAARRSETVFRQRQRYPDVFFAARGRYARAPGREEQESPFAYDTFNLFDAGVALGIRGSWGWGRENAIIRESAALAEAAAEKALALEQKLEQEVAEALHGYEAALAALPFAEDQYRAARAWSLSASNGFKLGLLPAQDLIQALKAYAEARLNRIETLRRQREASAKLVRNAGFDWPETP
ncbi:MAG: TolC family protein [Kiritimatiellia bacterium]|nr:TolC family protein [Kiritimatiellia bacterium]